ncbi:MAG: hydratase [Casimicrobiaceae bacterium]
MIPVQRAEAIATRLIAAYDCAEMLPPITQDTPDFDVDSAYRVLERIEARRLEAGWQPVGRKIGFTNTTIWPRYGVYQPMWAHIWQHTVHRAPDGRATLSLQGFVQPRIEPEVVFGIGGAIEPGDDPAAMLQGVTWIAPGFEIVQSHFPDWKFTAADCTAAFGLHGALVIGKPVALTAPLREALAEQLPRFALTLRRGDAVIDRGVGSNVLGGPAHALAHLTRVLAGQAWAPTLARDEIVTTGTISDAWPVEAGETWRSDYGELPLEGLELTFR